MIDFFTMTINNAEILKKTYESLNKNIEGIKLKNCNLYLNVDPHPNNENIHNLKIIGEQFFKEVIFNVPENCNCNSAFKWGLNNFKSDYLFIIEANKCIDKKFNINDLIEKLNLNQNIVEVSLSPPVKNNSGELLYLTSHPSLWKKSWLKYIYQYFSDYLNYEYQLRELALLDNKIGYSIATPKNIYLNHIGKKYKTDRKYILANSSTDEEINEINLKNGEWHLNIYNIFKSNKSCKTNKLNTFYKKIDDKEWIYRWTGIWKYVNNNNYYLRHLKKSYKCYK